MKANSLIRLVTSIGVVSSFAYACGADTGVDTDYGLPPSTGGRGGTGAGKGGAPPVTTGGSSGIGSATGGTTSAGSGLIDIPDASPDAPQDTSIAEDAACGSGSADANLLPVNMLVMFDRSTSMINEMSIDPVTMKDRWQTATEALTAFFQDPAADGLGVALRFFPHDLPAVGCTGLATGGCDAVACSMPMVDMAPLTAAAAPTDTQEAALVSAITSSAPVANMGMGMGMMLGTPIYAALDGALRWATAYQAANVEQRTVVLFVTDGEPNGCNTDFTDIQALASDAFAAAGIATYAIGLADSNGMGLNQANMDGLARAGGTEEAFFINDGPTASADLLETLNAIRGMALSCDFPLPEATNAGEEIDATLVNITFTAGDGTMTTFTKVTDAAGCDTAKSWYYDNDAAPTRIYLCPASCEAVTTDPDAHFGVLVGCKPEIEPPH